MDDKIKAIRNAANRCIQIGRWVVRYNSQFVFCEDNHIPIPETFSSKEAAVSWMEKEFENMGIFKDRGIDRYRIHETVYEAGEIVYLEYEANVRDIRIRWTLEKITASNIATMKKIYFRDAKKRLSR